AGGDCDQHAREEYGNNGEGQGHVNKQKCTSVSTHAVANISRCAGKSFNHPFVNDAVACHEATEIFRVGDVVLQRIAVQIRYPASSFVEDGLGAAGIPLAGSRAEHNIQVSYSFTDLSNLQSGAPEL